MYNVDVDVDGMKVRHKSSHKLSDFHVCTLGKFTQSRNRKPDASATILLESTLILLDLLIQPLGKVFRNCLAFKNDFSGAVFVYFLRNNSDTVAAAEIFLVDSVPYGKAKCIRSDNNGELPSGKFEALLKRNHIRHDTPAPYSPHQNSTAKWHWRTLFEMGSCLIIQ